MSDERMQRYSEVIIEHSQFPRHHGRLDDPTHQGQGENPFCGDRVTVQLAVNSDGVIEQARAESVGCAISIASASLLATHLQGLSIEQAGALFEQVRGIITDGSDESEDEELGELAALGFARHYPSRVKCATLAWHVLKHALDEDESVATTE
ncbi:MAG: SUF system NifU family Fe-S cluster assembly protein [Lysobacterales bacterium]|jgi:nitrogen fixation NifU-like protein